MMQLNIGVHGGRLRGHRAISRDVSRVPIPPCTGPLDALRYKRGLILVDVANLFCGAKRAGYELSFWQLASILKANLLLTDLHAFFAWNARSPGQESSFQARGYHTHQRDVQYVATVNGVERKSNCDNDILFGAGVLLATKEYEVVVVGTGDGDLAADLARGVHNLQSSASVVTVSFAHTTAWRLHSEANPGISDNILIGMDCLKPARPKPASFTVPFAKSLAMGEAGW